MKNACKRGFTLVELLVVVLIIGILSSVALPQYQKAVNKSRVAGYWPVLKNLAEAAKICKLEKGSVCNLDELDIEMPTCKPIPGMSGCSYSINEGFDSVSIVFGNHELELGIEPRGRFCADGGAVKETCKQYGLTGQSTGGSVCGSMSWCVLLDSTSR